MCLCLKTLGWRPSTEAPPEAKGGEPRGSNHAGHLHQSPQLTPRPQPPGSEEGPAQPTHCSSVGKEACDGALKKPLSGVTGPSCKDEISPAPGSLI